MTRASAVVKRQEILAWWVLRRSPGGDLGGERGRVGNAAVEALAGENGQVGLGQIEPAAVLEREVPFEPLDDPAGFGRLERLVQ